MLRAGLIFGAYQPAAILASHEVKFKFYKISERKERERGLPNRRDKCTIQYLNLIKKFYTFISLFSRMPNMYRSIRGEKNNSSFWVKYVRRSDHLQCWQLCRSRTASSEADIKVSGVLKHNKENIWKQLRVFAGSAISLHNLHFFMVHFTMVSETGLHSVKWQDD